jgi:glycosyl transferase, family 25
MWDFVDRVVYINLDKRPDRNERMLRDILPTFGNKVSRMPAIESSPGYIGCLQSHIRVLEDARRDNVRNVLILEDDVEWNNFALGYKVVERLARWPYDVIHFGPSAADGTMLPNIAACRLLSGQATSSYLINRHYINTLLECYKYALPRLIETKNDGVYGSDQCWKPLMRTGRWFSPIPVLMYQQPGFSDIQQEYMDGSVSWILKV